MPLRLNQSDQVTPSSFIQPATGSSQTKKTRLGSTDHEGNRLSNLPGERPSLHSVTPYDDKPSELIKKVESCQPAKPKSSGSLLTALTKQQEEVMKSKRVIANDGKAFERKNFVKINL